MINKDYVPAKIAEFHDFVINLMNVLFLHLLGTARPWGYTDANYNSLNADVNSFKAAYDIANPAGKKGSRTPAQTLDMDEKRDVCETHVRAFVKQWLAFNPAVTNPDKIDMGLPVLDDERTAVPTPTTHVVVDLIDSNEVKKHTIHFHDELSESKAKPFGVAYCQIKYSVAIDPPDSEDDANLIAQSTETPAIINFGATDSGKTAFYYFRWVNTRGEVGPWSIRYFAPIR